MKEFRTSDNMVQYTMVAWFLGSSFLALILGPISERIGRRVVFLAGTLNFVISSLLCAIAPNIYTLILLRFIQGGSVCFIVIAGYSTVHCLYEGRKAIQLVSTIISITVLAPAIGPYIGSLIVYYGNWRDIFFILCGAGMVGLILAYLFIPETLEDKIKSSPTQILHSYLRIILNRDLMRFTMLDCLLYSNFYAWIVESPIIIIKTFKNNEMYFGTTQIPIFACFMVGSHIAKYLIKHQNPKTILKLGISIVCLGVVLLVITAMIYNNVPCAVFAMSLIALGTAMTTGTFGRLATEASEENMGNKMAVFSTLIALSGTVGGLIITLVGNGTLLRLSLVIFVFSLLVLVLFLSTPKTSFSLKKRII